MDHLHASCKPIIAESGVLMSGLSDHDLIFATLKRSLPKLPPHKYKDFKSLNTEQFLNNLNSVDWDVIDERKMLTLSTADT